MVSITNHLYKKLLSRQPGFERIFMSNPTKPSALVTGASSGLGEAFARSLAARGYNLTITARRGYLLERIAAKLRDTHGTNIVTLEADLGKPTGINTLEKHLAENPVDFLVNNAGFGLYKPVSEIAGDDLEAMVQLNVIALLRLTRAALPSMIARNSGTIINVGSGLAFNPSATRATYSGTKAFVLNFTESLTDELKDTHIKVQTLIPGLIRTEFHDHSGTDISRIPPHMVMSAEDVVSGSLRGLELGELICVPALPNVGDLSTFAAARGAVAQNLIRDAHLAERYRV
jgi:uncharacterized protein